MKETKKEKVEETKVEEKTLSQEEIVQARRQQFAAYAIEMKREKRLSKWFSVRDFKRKTKIPTEAEAELLLNTMMQLGLCIQRRENILPEYLLTPSDEDIISMAKYEILLMESSLGGLERKIINKLDSLENLKGFLLEKKEKLNNQLETVNGQLEEIEKDLSKK